MADKRIADHLLTKTYTAGEALEANRFVKGDTGDAEGRTVIYADAGEAAIGVNRDKLALGQLADIVLAGTAYLMTSENVTINDPVSADADGKAQVASGTDQVLGRAVSNANSGGYVKVLLGVGGAF